MSTLTSLVAQNLHLEKQCGQYVFGSEAVSDNDIARLRILTGAVTSLTTSPTLYSLYNSLTVPNELPLSEPVILKLLEYLDGEPLLLSLEKLSISIKDFTDEHIKELELSIPLVLTPSLHTLELYGIQKQSKDSVGALLASLPQNSPYIRTLDICIWQTKEFPKFSPAFIDSWLLKLTYLTHLELYNVIDITDFGVIRGLGRLPNITNFVFCHDSRYIPGYKYRGGDEEEGFMKLEELEVRGPIALVADIVHHIGTKTLKFCKFQAYIRRENWKEPWNICTETVRKVFRKYDLIRLRGTLLRKLGVLEADPFLEWKIIQDYIPMRWPALKLPYHPWNFRMYDDWYYLHFSESYTWDGSLV